MTQALFRSPRGLAVSIALVLAVGVMAAIARAPEGPRFERASAAGGDIARLQSADDVVAVSGLEGVPTSAPPVGGLDISTNAPAGTELTLPELAPVDFGGGAVASAPVTGGLTDLIKAFFGDATVEALVIVQCESQFIPWAVGTNTNGTQDHGLFQINDIHAPGFESVTGVPWESGRYDPVANTTFARYLYDLRGWDAWTCRSRLGTVD